MPTGLKHQIGAALDADPVSLVPLGGGSVSEVYRVLLADGREIVAKVDHSAGAQLEVEAFMLRFLRDHSQLPVPTVFYASGGLLLLQFVSGHASFSDLAQEHAAELLAELHSITSPTFGFDCPTVIGGLHQPNPVADNWLEFFREQRPYQPGKWISPSSVVHRKVVTDSVGNWKHYTDTRIFPEEDLWQRIFLAGYRMSLVLSLTVWIVSAGDWESGLIRQRNLL